MKASQRFLLVIGAALLACNCYGYSRLGMAAVRDVDGIPCFGVADYESARAKGRIEFGALSVYDETVKTNDPVWEMQIINDAKIIDKNTCFRYGEIPEGGKGSKALMLFIGRIYLVALNARPTKPTDPTFGYQIRFCLSRDVDGKAHVHQLEWRSKRGIHDYSVCKDELAG
jgi:hypothetical protein